MPCASRFIHEGGRGGAAETKEVACVVLVSRVSRPHIHRPLSSGRLEENGAVVRSVARIAQPLKEVEVQHLSGGNVGDVPPRPSAELP